MKNTELIVLSALVLLGIVGAMTVMKTQTTAQLTYTTHERPAAFQRALTLQECQSVEPDLSLNTIECQNKVIWECNYLYPMTPGGAENPCRQVCIQNSAGKCLSRMTK